MSKIREAYLQRCEIGLLDCEREMRVSDCAEKMILYEGGGVSRRRHNVEATNFYSETLPFDIYNPVKHSPSAGYRCSSPSCRKKKKEIIIEETNSTFGFT